MAWQQPSMHSQQMKQAHMSTVRPSPIISQHSTNKQTYTHYNSLAPSPSHDSTVRRVRESGKVMVWEIRTQNPSTPHPQEGPLFLRLLGFAVGAVRVLVELVSDGPDTV